LPFLKWNTKQHWISLPGPDRRDRGGALEAAPVIAAGTALYVWCVWNVAAVGGGTPRPWDPPSRVVAAGPYRWVRNPIYLAALLIVLGQAWLFLSLPLLAYAGAVEVVFHLIVTATKNRRCAAASAAPTWSTSARSCAGSPAARATVETTSCMSFIPGFAGSV